MCFTKFMHKVYRVALVDFISFFKKNFVLRSGNISGILDLLAR